MNPFTSKRLGLVFLMLALVVGCGNRDEAAAPPPAESEPVVDGISPDQIRAQAEEMSPQRAEELGIIDTTIHMENINPDTVVGLDTVPGMRPRN